MFYTDNSWHRYVEAATSRKHIKSYLHFDNRFDFHRNHSEIQKIVAKSSLVAKHSFLPFLKVLIKTPRYRFHEASDKSPEGYDLETKVRPIAYASHFDSYLYGFYSFVINEKYQAYINNKGFGDKIIAYRTDLDGKCNVQFAKEVFDYIKSVGPCVAITMDIKGYFDSIDHELLKYKLCKLLNKSTLPDDLYNIYKSITKYSYVNRNNLLKHYKIDLRKIKFKDLPSNILELLPLSGGLNARMVALRKKNFVTPGSSHEPVGDWKRYYGIPQGAAISALFSNIYLMDLDQEIGAWSDSVKFLYRRYCDDILIVAPHDIATTIQERIIELVGQHFLKLNQSKTEIITFQNDGNGRLRGYDSRRVAEASSVEVRSHPESYYGNLQYLGFEFNGQNIYVRSSSLARYFIKLRARVAKTVYMATSPNKKGGVVFKQQLYSRYTHWGKRNFLSYVYNASKKNYKNADGVIKIGMDSKVIRAQVSRHIDRLQHELETIYRQRKAKQELKKGIKFVRQNP